MSAALAYSTVIFSSLFGMVFWGEVLDASAWFAIGLIQRNADIESLALPISSAWLYVPLLPAGLVTVAQALADLVQLLRRSVERAA